MQDPFDDEISDGSVFEQDGRYVLKVGGKASTLTNFVFIPDLKLKNPNGTKSEWGTLIIEGREEHHVTLPYRIWNNRKDVADAVGGYGGLFFTSSNTQTALIRQYVTLHTAADLPEARSVTSYGLHPCNGGWAELHANRPFSEAEGEKLFYTGTPMDNSNGQFDAPPVAATKLVDETRERLPLLLQLTDPAVAAAMMGYAAASPSAPRLTPHLGNRLPFLYCAGEKESGKTSQGELILELVTGSRSRTANAMKLSDYQYDAAFANANNQLSILDEYRSGGLDDAQLRKHHDLGNKRRGTGVAGSDDIYHLNAPMIVLGEGFSEDAATLSRGALYFFKKADRSSLFTFREASEVRWWAYASHLHKLAVQLSEEEHLKRVEQAGAHVDMAAPHVPPRLRHALVFITYGLLTLQADAGDGVFSNDLIESVICLGAKTTLDGGTETKTNLETFLEQLGVIVPNLPRPESVISAAAAPDHIIIHASSAVGAVRGRLGKEAAVTNPRLFKQYALESGFFEPGETHRNHHGKSVRGLKLDLKRVPERCDVASLIYLHDLLRGIVKTNDSRPSVTSYDKAA